MNISVKIIDAFEIGLFPVTQTLGEPQLSRRNLYPYVSKKWNIESITQPPDFPTKEQKNLMKTRNLVNILAYSNGKISIFDICKKINLSLEQTLASIKVLRENKLLKTKY